MRKITAEGLKDFQMCALLHEYRHIQNVDEAKNIRERRIEKFDETIKRVCAFFFYKKQAYAEPSFQALLNRWQKLWFAEATTAADIAAMKNEILWGSETSYTTQASAALLTFHEEFSNKTEEQVILVDEKFCVPLNKSVALEGVFDLVLREQRNGKTHYKIYKWITNNLKKPISYWIFDFAILDHAFRHRNHDKFLSVSYYLWDFGSSNPGFKEIAINMEDLSILQYWANTLDETEIYVPRRGLTSYCKSCPFDRPCSKWQFPSKEYLK